MNMKEPTHAIQIIVPKSFYRRLKQFALDHDSTVPAIIRLAAAEYLDRLESRATAEEVKR
jgi:hypothetical protein